jgi:hypothetical protein
MVWFSGEVLHCVERNSKALERKLAMIVLAKEGTEVVLPDHTIDYSKSETAPETD